MPPLYHLPRTGASECDAGAAWVLPGDLGLTVIAKALRDFKGKDVRSRLEWRWDKTDVPVNGRHHNQTVLANFIYVFSPYGRTTRIRWVLVSPM